MNADEIMKESEALFEIIKKAHCFQKTDFTSRYMPQLYRNMVQFRNLTRKIDITKKKLPEYLNWYKQNYPEMPMTQSDFMIEIVTLLCSHGLATFEFLKRFLLLTLNFQQLFFLTSASLGEFSMLGDLVNKGLAKLPNVNISSLKKLIDLDFRNALGHDSWYIEGMNWKYTEKGGLEVSIPINDMHKKIYTVFGVTSALSRKYLETYFPEYTDEYNNGLGKIMDEIMPLNPRNDQQDAVSKPSQ